MALAKCCLYEKCGSFSTGGKDGIIVGGWVVAVKPVRGKTQSYTQWKHQNETGDLLSMARLQATHTVKKGCEGQQKFRPKRPRRTIYDGEHHDVQCRFSVIVRGVLDLPALNQGKYEEKKKRRGGRIGEARGE